VYDYVIRRATEFFTEILHKRRESFKICMTTGPKKSYQILHTNSSQEMEVLEDLHG
jgi:hypothetical protein